MFWLFAMATTAGLIIGVPTVLQAIDGTTESHDGPQDTTDDPALPNRHTAGSLSAFAAFALIAGGIGGLVALAFEPANWIALTVAACLGLAAGALHPEVLHALAWPDTTEATETADAYEA